MAANIAEVRANVRKDLHDEDSAAYRWTDAVLDRHITRAVREYSIEAPLEQRTTLYGRVHTVGRRLPAPTATPVTIGRA